MAVLLLPEDDVGILLLSGLTKLWTGLRVLCEIVLLILMFPEGVTVLCWFPVPVLFVLGLVQALLFLVVGIGDFAPDSPLCVLVE